MKQSLQRTVKAQLRDARLLLQESRLSLILFLIILVGGALFFNFFYIGPDADERLDFVQSLYATFALIFFQNILPFPGQWYLQTLYFIVTILGLSAVAEGVLHFWVTRVDKQGRGQKRK